MTLYSPIPGNRSGTSVPAGMIGEQISSSNSTVANVGSSGTYTDITSITLTPGVWDINAVVYYTPNGSTGQYFDFFIGTVAGANTTGRLSGDNQVVRPVASNTYDDSLTLSQYRVTVTTNTTYYLKLRCGYSAGTPQRAYRMSAIRVG